ncbi:hypothetical protein GCM10022380_51790 [Amycolatopsis tucumanensis]|uniref:Uncharacterized protein n=1 Tax=Amycolatopsis tucumanensis TaxID=401106 RepID=A0ABP7ITQ6_9PSEU
MARTRLEARQRGRIEQRGDSLRVVLYAGIDPVTGRRSYLRETIKGSDDAAWRKAAETHFRREVRPLRQHRPTARHQSAWPHRTEPEADLLQTVPSHPADGGCTDTVRRPSDCRELH